MKRIYIILTFFLIGFLAFFIEATHTMDKGPNGNLLTIEMADSVWSESEALHNVKKNSRRNLLRKELTYGKDGDNLDPEEFAEKNNSSNLEEQELADEADTQSLAALEWGEVPLQNVYESYYVFSFEEMEYADDKEFAHIRDIFSTIPFCGGFPLGDAKKYKICKDKFAQLLKNEITVMEPETGEEHYLEQFDLVIYKYEDKPYDLGRYHFYLFDVDGNDAPELCVFDLLYPEIINSMCIFKYDFDLDQIILWEYFPSHYTLLLGMNSIGGENGNANEYDFYQVDENANPILRTGFVYEGIFTNGNLVCMVILPQYKNANKDEQIENMKKKAFYDKETGGYYLRITEEQYEELSSYYFKAREKASEELDKLEMSYSELFG